MPVSRFYAYRLADFELVTDGRNVSSEIRLPIGDYELETIQIVGVRSSDSEETDYELSVFAPDEAMSRVSAAMSRQRNEDPVLGRFTVNDQTVETWKIELAADLVPTAFAGRYLQDSEQSGRNYGLFMRVAGSYAADSDGDGKLSLEEATQKNVYGQQSPPDHAVDIEEFVAIYNSSRSSPSRGGFGPR